MLPYRATKTQIEVAYLEYLGPANESGCMFWTGHVSPIGIPQFRDSNALRWAYTHFVGPIPAATILRLHCRNPTCQTLSHVYFGQYGRGIGPKDHMERYLSFIGPIDGNGCSEWIGQLTTKGYGHFNVNSVGHIASRWGYEQLIGPIPPGLLVCHHCDNPPCQTPEHWFLGTHKDNYDDMVKKGRAHWQKVSRP